MLIRATPGPTVGAARVRVLIPAIRALFNRRFGEERIATGGELTSIAHGLALIGEESDPAEWAA